MKTNCTFMWSDTRKVNPVSRQHCADAIRMCRVRGFVFRLRSDNYRLKFNNFDVPCAINTRA